MPPFNITDLDDVRLVTIFQQKVQEAWIPEISFSHWIRGCTGLTNAQVATAIETPLAALLGSTTTAGIRNVMSNSSNIIRTEISSPLLADPRVAVATTRNLAGNSNGTLPPEVAMVVSFRTELGGPAYRGRAYIGCIGYDTYESVTGKWATSKQTALITAWGTYQTALQALTGDFEQITVSRFHNVAGVPTPRATPIGATVLEYAIDLFTDTQRRRSIR